MQIVLGLFCITLVAGCATTQKLPIKLDPNYHQKGIETIVMMPVIDRRVDKSSKIDFNKDLRLPAKAMLEKKGYQVMIPSVYRESADVTQDEITEMDIEELSQLGPVDARALLYIYVEDILDSYVVISYNFKIEATGSLIHKQEKTELWRDKGLGTQGQAGLISGAFSAWDKQIAITACLESLLSTLPSKNPDPKKIAAKASAPAVKTSSQPVIQSEAMAESLAPDTGVPAKPSNFGPKK